MSVFTDEYTWYVAKDKDDLRKLVVEEYRIQSDLDFTETEWIECNPEQEMTIIRDMELPESEWIKDVKTFAEWEEHNGRGFLASTEW